MEADITLPDHCPDIARIVKVDCTPIAESCLSEDGRITVKGRAVFDVLYETDYKNRLRCHSFTRDFSHSFPLPVTNAVNIGAFCNMDCKRIDCRLLSDRRLILRSMLGIELDSEGDIAVKVISPEEDGCTFFRKKTIGFEGRTVLLEESFGFSEEMPLNRNEKCINEILCGTITLSPPQVDLSPGRAEISTHATFHALCEEENNEGAYYMSVKTLPLKLEFTNEGIEDFKRASVSLLPVDCQFHPELDQYGEHRIIRCDFSVKMQMKINEPKAHTVAEDMFEKSYTSQGVSILYPIPFAEELCSCGFTAEGKLSPSEPLAESILDVTAKSCGCTVESTEEGLFLKGNFTATVIMSNQQGIQCCDITLPYRQSFTASPSENSTLSAQVMALEAIPTLHSDGSIGVRVIAEARVFGFGHRDEEFLSSVTKRTPIEAPEEGTRLTFCFPRRDECLWDIAKLYHVSPERIAAANPESFGEGGELLKLTPIVIKS